MFSLADFDQFFIEFRQSLADDIGVTANVHIIRIAVPAGDDVDVQVVEDAGAGAGRAADRKTRFRTAGSITSRRAAC